MITVEVIVYATLVDYVPGSRPGAPLAVRLEKGKTVLELLEQLGIPGEKTKLVFINGVSRNMDHILNDGDRVGIFPPIAGG
ncbi:MAG: MoaD/ThiS family protein [Peptococcaceae bacterium]|jgi:molybdopterin converting factor small subunit|nr:MoaD/ThiS family protein [Peptococcaceae bacterium]MDH7523873.1 MoaD/ThiS family protein [Peptococcaceae bacterium]